MKFSITSFNKTLPLIIFLIAGLNISCNKSANNHPTQQANQGGQDSGGGSTRGSGYGDVELQFENKAALDREINFLFGYIIAKDRHDVNSEKFISSFFHEENQLLQIEIRKRVKILDEEINKKLKQKIVEQSERDRERDKALGRYSDDDGFTHKERFDELKPAAIINRTQDIKDFESNINISSSRSINWGEYFPKSHGGQDSGGESYFASITINTILNSVKYKLKYDGPCLDRHNNEKTAAVSEFNLNSEICIDVAKLTKIPVEGLKKQVHALLIHEIMHLLGFYENEAQEAQDYILKYYDEIVEAKLPLEELMKMHADRVNILAEYMRIYLSSYNFEKFNSAIKNKDNDFFNGFHHISLLQDDVENLSFLINVTFKYKPQSGDRYRKLMAIQRELDVFRDDMRHLRLIFNCFKSCDSKTLSDSQYSNNYKIIRDRLVFFANRFSEYKYFTPRMSDRI